MLIRRFWGRLESSNGRGEEVLFILVLHSDGVIGLGRAHFPGGGIERFEKLMSR